MKPLTGLLIVGGAALASFALTRGALQKPVAPPPPPPPPGGGGAVITPPKPAPGYAQALYDAPTGQWYWFPQPQPYVVDAQGYPVPATPGQSPAGMGIPIPNPYGQIPGAPDLQTANLVPSDAWYGFNPVGLLQTTALGFAGLVSALSSAVGNPLSPSESVPGATQWAFGSYSSGASFPGFLTQTWQAKDYAFISLKDLEAVKKGAQSADGCFAVSGPNVPGFVGYMRASYGDLVLISSPSSAS